MVISHSYVSFPEGTSLFADFVLRRTCCDLAATIQNHCGTFRMGATSNYPEMTPSSSSGWWMVNDFHIFSLIQNPHFLVMLLISPGNPYLVGGLEHFSCSIIYGLSSFPTDELIFFQRGRSYTTMKSSKKSPLSTFIKGNNLQGSSISCRKKSFPRLCKLCCGTL